MQNAKEETMMNNEEEWQENVRPIESGAVTPRYIDHQEQQQRQQQRTDAQRHADTAWDAAQAELDAAAQALANCVQWVQSLGVSVPKGVQDVKSVLSEYRAKLIDERATRG